MVATKILRYMGVSFALSALATSTAATSDASFGTLLSCEGERCLWADKNGGAISKYEVMRQLMRENELDFEEHHDERRRLMRHVEYIEDVHRIAAQRGLEFRHLMGVNARHLFLDHDRELSADQFVQRELHAAHRRRLEESENGVPRRLTTSSLPTSMNWCTTENPLKKNVCTRVKSQAKCGSCWAFAASDAIETAVAVANDGPAMALSPQQFLDCSRRNMTETFNYCWAQNGVSSASWLKPTMPWKSSNNGCDGGMTHGAFMDAAQYQLALVSEVYIPYKETITDLTLVPGFTHAPTATPKTEEERNKSCVIQAQNASAMITGWKQAVGDNCDASTDSAELLKIALQEQPISVAINSGGTFKEYKGGIYECPNNGDFPTSSMVDHAIVLVGYGVEGSTEYWILKNSYSSSWGEKGFMRLKMDAKINCGVSIFPVIPTGATKGAGEIKLTTGGDTSMLGLTPFLWVAIAAVTTIATVVLTAVGVMVHKRRRSALHKDAVMG